MNQNLRQELMLFKFKIISPVLMEPGRAQKLYFKTVSQTKYTVPGKGERYIKASTMKSWLYSYKKFGIKGLESKNRSDSGQIRFNLEPEGIIKIEKFRKENLDITMSQFHRKCLLNNLLGTPPMSYSTLARLLKKRGLNIISHKLTPRKKFEMRIFGEMWVGDYMHGPKVLESTGGKTYKKAILLAFIDDYSRYIVGAEFNFLESSQTIEQVLKTALLTHGVPTKLYLDNGPSFSSHYLLKVCAELNISLIHSKPYDSPSRGKIERFFRTVRDKFLCEYHEVVRDLDIKSFNDQFQKWLEKEYQRHYHKGIDGKPIERYFKSIESYPLKRVEESLLNEYFLTAVKRKVKKDSTISINKIIYEVPNSYIGSYVQIKWPLDRPKDLYIYEDDRRVQKISPVDVIFNGIYKPRARLTDVCLHDEEDK
jgi:transposase InsO family protein